MKAVVGPAAPAELESARGELCGLVRDAVEGGASIGFVLPLDDGVLDAYCGRVIGDVERGERLVVHSSARRQGLGTRLMEAIESAALERGRTLLVLDTITASEADPLYRGLGYTEAGEIPEYAGMPDGVLAPTTVFYKTSAR